MNKNYNMFVNIQTGRAVVINYDSTDYIEYSNNSEWKHVKDGPKKALQEEADELNSMLMEE